MRPCSRVTMVGMTVMTMAHGDVCDGSGDSVDRAVQALREATLTEGQELPPVRLDGIGSFVRSLDDRDRRRQGHREARVSVGGPISLVLEVWSRVDKAGAPDATTAVLSEVYVEMPTPVRSRWRRGTSEMMRRDVTGETFGEFPLAQAVQVMESWSPGQVLDAMPVDAAQVRDAVEDLGRNVIPAMLGVSPGNAAAIEALMVHDWWGLSADDPEVQLALAMFPNP